MRRLAAILFLSPALAFAQDRVTYEDHVAPILEDACVSCHDASDASGGLSLQDYGSLMRGGASGEVIAPGNAEGSKLFRQVSRQEKPFMPKGGEALSKAQLKTLRRWIDGGALESRGSKPRAPKRSADMTLKATPQVRAAAVMPQALSLQPVERGERPPATIALAGAPAAPLLAVAGFRQVLLYHAERGELLGVLPFRAGRVHRVAFSRDGARLLAAGGQAAKQGHLRVWDVATGRPLFELTNGNDAFLAADVRSDMRQVACGGPSKTVRVFDTRTGGLDHQITKHTDWVTAIAYSPDGVLLASADRAGGLHVWESLSGREYLALAHHPQAVTSLAWRADSNVLATACEDGNLRLFRLKDGKLIRTWKAHPVGVTCVTFWPDGRLASAGRDRRVKVWKPDGKPLQDLPGARDITLSVAVVDGRLVASGDWTGRVRTWDTAGKILGDWDPNPLGLEGYVEEAVRMHRTARDQKNRLTVRSLAATAERARDAQALAQGEQASRIATKEAAEVPAGEQIGDELSRTLRQAVLVAKRQVSLREGGEPGPALERARATLAQLQAQLQATDAELAAAREASAPRKAELAKRAQSTAQALSAARATAQQSSARADALAREEARASKALARAEAYLARWRAELAIGDVYAERDAADRERRVALAASLSAGDRLAQAQADLASARAAEQKIRERRARVEQAAALTKGFMADARALHSQLRASLAAAKKLRAAETVSSLEDLLSKTQSSLARARQQGAAQAKTLDELQQAIAAAKATTQEHGPKIRRAEAERAGAKAAAETARAAAEAKERTLQDARRRLIEQRKRRDQP